MTSWKRAAGQLRRAKREVEALIDEVMIVEVTEGLIAAAVDMAEEEALRACDAVHLASALATRSDLLASADSSLRDAAARRGLHVANPLIA